MTNESNPLDQIITKFDSQKKKKKKKKILNLVMIGFITCQNLTRLVVGQH